MNNSLIDRIDKALSIACEHRHDESMDDNEYYSFLYLILTKAMHVGRPSRLPFEISEKLDDTTWKAIITHLQNREKLQAVKMVKYATDLDLKSSKDVVDEIILPWVEQTLPIVPNPS